MGHNGPTGPQIDRPSGWNVRKCMGVRVPIRVQIEAVQIGVFGDLGCIDIEV
ncbi:hypothetical protein DY000_02011955 [Brassica cretica]|uniref:Uncharacterized protein n=1 Tax=Brassica cretica TaxID=69181 RepID=A0ABQ7CL84_BRACR|nr:hypothetical protein DY000_02011955 [Brassica cretica]